MHIYIHMYIVKTNTKFIVEQVNAFADKPFSGNPAAVFLVPPLGSEHKNAWSVDDKIMQQIAAEMKLSESAFLTPTDHVGCFHTSTQFLLRWFTPTKEVDLCGHATIARCVCVCVRVCVCVCVYGELPINMFLYVCIVYSCIHV
jgi:PhzF family phenazine biosynthesis protein